MPKSRRPSSAKKLEARHNPLSGDREAKPLLLLPVVRTSFMNRQQCLALQKIFRNLLSPMCAFMAELIADSKKLKEYLDLCLKLYQQHHPPRRFPDDVKISDVLYQIAKNLTANNIVLEIQICFRFFRDFKLKRSLRITPFFLLGPSSGKEAGDSKKLKRPSPPRSRDKSSGSHSSGDSPHRPSRPPRGPGSPKSPKKIGTASGSGVRTTARRQLRAKRLRRDIPPIEVTATDSGISLTSALDLQESLKSKPSTSQGPPPPPKVHDKVDMNKLKITMWQLLTSPEEEIAGAYGPVQIYPTTFKKLFEKVLQIVPPEVREQLSVHLVFMALLELASERSILLTPTSDSTDPNDHRDFEIHGDF